MDDVELRRREKQERRAHLLRELAREVERDAAKVCISQEVVEIVGKELKDQAQVVAEHEVTLQFNCK